MSPTPAISPQAALETWFPRAAFRDRQLDAVERIWSGRSSLVLMPTGTGKSLIYQLPVLASGKVGLVISPLVALMSQQAKTLDKLGASVMTFSAVDSIEAQERMRQFQWNAGPSFLFISPERAETDGYLEHLLREHRDRIALVAVDEAHCISEWGHDFRPPYKAIPTFLDRAFGRGGWPPVLCLTATLNTRAQAEILADFRMTPMDVVRSGNMLRTNLSLRTEQFGDHDSKLTALDGLMADHRGEKLIVYAHLKQNRKSGTRALAERYRQQGHRCEPFDADLDPAQKERILAGFAGDEIDVVFATGAFGMGVDIPDIRGVIHYLLPESLEQYYQEVGRAGRDGAPAFGVLLYTPTNARVRRDQIKKSRVTVAQVMEVWDEVCAAGRGNLRSLTPWVEFNGREPEYALFHAFRRVGALEIVARGPNRLSSFEPRGPAGARLLSALMKATRLNTTAGAIRNLQLDASGTIEEMFRLYDRGELKLVRSPDKTMFFRTLGLDEEQAAEIAAGTEEKVARRLEEFESFVRLVEAGDDPEAVLASRFG